MISIIIPNFNGEKTLARLIESIMKSNLKNYEIIIVDDSSTDDSLLKLNHYKINLVKTTTRAGASSARNKGISQSNGDIILFIDNDAWLAKDAIKSLLDYIEKKDIAFPRILYENGKCFYPCLENEKKYPFISCCFLIKKESLKKLDENFDENYQTYLEDADFFHRCKLAGLKAAYCEDAIVYHDLKEEADFGERYYLELRNILYGRQKFKEMLKKSEIYNPFSLVSFFKSFFFGIMNFAWFDWSCYDRKTKKIEKKKKIFLHSRFRAITLALKSIKEYWKIKKKAEIKNASLKEFMFH